MPAPLLDTKLYAPRPRPDVVLRPRLLARLEAGRHHRLVLVSAPAGFGKTTLIGSWIARGGRPAAWLSLDAGDDDPGRFLAYLVAALRTALPELGSGTLDAFADGRTPLRAALALLVNELAAPARELVLVLDDYHRIGNAEIHEGLAFLLEHLPPTVQLAIGSRADPPLPLARLRARGEMTELRAADLRFTPDEATTFLGDTMGLALSGADVAALEARTEGWIAGLQLAGLSLQARDDASAFIRDFAGDHRYVLDYLVEEVLGRQPEAVRDFLLRTAVLGRLCAPLCDAVTGRGDGRERLGALERGNLFLVPLDDRRRWYRYHHLFADALRAHAADAHPERIPELHRRASAWYEEAELLPEAIDHALAAGAFERAAGLIERAAPELQGSRQEATLLVWLEALPDELVRARPLLAAEHVGALFGSGRIDAADERLRDVQRWLREADGSGARGADRERLRLLPMRLAIYRAARAQALGDVPGSERDARRVLELAGEDDHAARGAANCLLGLAHWAHGRLEAGHRTFAAGRADLARGGNVSAFLGGTLALADIRLAQGRLREAVRSLEEAIASDAARSDPVPAGVADLHAALAELRCERNDLAAAAEELRRSEALGADASLTEHRSRRRAAMARLAAARGEPERALELLGEAERLWVGGFGPNMRPLAARRARLQLARGAPDEAEVWARERGLSARDDLDYLREFEHLTLARLLLARSRDRRRNGGRERTLREATELLERLLEAAEAGERGGSVLEILALQALAHAARGDVGAALEPLRRALALAEPEGYVRTFVDEGAPMARLLAAAVARGGVPDYARQLLAAFGPAGRTPAAGGGAPPPAGPLAEPLNEREIEVLRLVADGLSNREIGARLHRALDTVKGYNRSIFGKLEVHNRTEAVARARELGLL